MKIDPRKQFGHPSTLRNGPFVCKGFESSSWHTRSMTGARFALTDQQQKWISNVKR